MSLKIKMTHVNKDKASRHILVKFLNFRNRKKNLQTSEQKN